MSKGDDLVLITNYREENTGLVEIGGYAVIPKPTSKPVMIDTKQNKNIITRIVNGMRPQKVCGCISSYLSTYGELDF